ncbi:flagellar hook protein [Variovorax sp. WS11]|uniref:flagellar filament capping protein FliD n=1 Tax=Variovorax sp. WS11 TaxID=1105204 RepID=UPI000D0D97A5|nr:flagellar filament capping protein FliD [Variovorax sp. WS11]NDZ15823.1 flagellar filament capping protein FliD [Variovorax sp. WS11]PSL79983.1 flagellar hook protein [Variovorax sp. WS11]
MAVSSIGVGSGLDLATLLTNLETAESQPLAAIQARATSYTTKLSAYSQVQSALNVLKTASDKLADPDFFKTVKASISDADVLGVTTGDTAVAGSYTIDVTQLAQSQSLVSAGQASAKTAIGNGTITINFGTIHGGTLNAGTGQYTGASFDVDADRTAAQITIGTGSNTLEGIRDAINKANAGVTASVVNDGSGTPNRLVLVSTESGEASTMQISVAGDAALQNLLAYDPAGTQTMKQTAVGQDAKLNINGIDVVSASNTVLEGIQGTTLTLAKTGSTSLKLTSDTASVSTAIAAFVTAYNSLQSTASKLTAYDADTKKGAALMGDQTLRNLLTEVRQTLSAAQESDSGGMKVLSEIGVSFQKDGTLAVDASKLSNALSKSLSGVAGLFSSGTGSTSGYAKQLSALVTEVTGSDGALTTATNGVNTTLEDLSDQYNAVQARVDSTVERYRAQFTQLDVLINTLNNTMTYLTQQFDAMNATSSSK